MIANYIILDRSFCTLASSAKLQAKEVASAMALLPAALAATDIDDQYKRAIAIHAEYLKGTADVYGRMSFVCGGPRCGAC